MRGDAGNGGRGGEVIGPELCRSPVAMGGKVEADGAGEGVPPGQHPEETIAELRDGARDGEQVGKEDGAGEMEAVALVIELSVEECGGARCGGVRGADGEGGRRRGGAGGAEGGSGGWCGRVSGETQGFKEDVGQGGVLSGSVCHGERWRGRGERDRAEGGRGFADGGSGEGEAGERGDALRRSLATGEGEGGAEETGGCGECGGDPG